jgi:hypothetical protein
MWLFAVESVAELLRSFAVRCLGPRMEVPRLPIGKIPVVVGLAIVTCLPECNHLSLVALPAA